MAGRPGRRGFEAIGNLVTLGVSDYRMQELLLAPFPALQTANLLDVSTVLKALILRTQTPGVTDLLSRLRTTPLGQDPSVSKVTDEIVLRFSIQLFSAMKLIDPTTLAPTGLAGLVSRMTEVYPANILLAYFFMKGPLHTNPSLLEEKNLLALICYLIPNLYFDSHESKALQLPQTCARVARGYRKFLWRVGLRLFHINLHNKDDPGLRVVSVLLKSLYVGLPSDPSLLNSYAVDFLRHRSIAQLVQQNGMPDSQAYFRVERCKSYLSKIGQSMRECLGADSPIADAFVRLATAFKQALKEYQTKASA
jgi:hypothetical protein